MPIHYPALAVFIVAIVLVIVALVRRKSTKELAWLTSVSLFATMFLIYVHDYGGVDATVVRETALGIPIPVGIFFLIVWLGRWRQRRAHDAGK